MLVEAEAENVAKQAAQALEASRRLVMETQADSGTLTWTGRHGVAGATADQLNRPRFGPKAKRKPGDTHSKGFASVSSTSDRPLFSGVKKMRSAEELSSTDLLAEIRSRRQRTLAMDDQPESGQERREGVLLPSGNGTKAQAPPSLIPPRFEQLMNELRLFLVFGGKNADGKATTQEILAKFGNRIQSQDSSVFRSMLKRICDFQRGADGEGVWVLKTAFR